MKLTLKALPLFALLTFSSSMAMASTVNLGAVFHLREETQSTDYTVTILSAQTTARTTDDNSKLLGQWKTCFKRHENTPPMPFQKYVYVPLNVFKDSTALVTAGDRTLEINDALIADIDEAYNELVQKTDGKCKLATETKIEYRIEMKGTKATIRSEVWISKKGNTMSMTYAKWVGGKQGFVATTETLPNKTPVQIISY